ncbi:MAG: hypothetical protein B6U76_00995 [Desulfurococcales archaeon ex4484_217_2]|nr:MAG: hypothetical protein B6U76_00995 [Desulfurococcales archaeon ex4484_217_2]
METYVGKGVGAYFLNKLLMAEKYVYVASRWISPEYAGKLVGKAREGVEVKIITSDDREKHHQEALKILLKAVKPPILRIKKWVPPNMELGIVRQEFLHVKMYVFDDEMAVVGSANFTHHGLWGNIEHIVVFTKPGEVEKLRKDFLTLWKLYTEEKHAVKQVITLEDIAKKLGKTIKELMKAIKKH